MKLKEILIRDDGICANVDRLSEQDRRNIYPVEGSAIPNLTNGDVHHRLKTSSKARELHRRVEVAYRSLPIALSEDELKGIIL